MKRLCACVLCTVLLFSLSACYGTTRSVATTEPPTTVAPSNQPPPDSVGLAYTVNADGKTCTVTGIGTCTDTDLRIGEKIDGYTVTAIGKDAFANGNHLTSIILPITVTYIDGWAFSDCTDAMILCFNGNAEDWRKVSVDTDPNGCILPYVPFCHYYSEDAPVEKGYFWHYVNSIPTVWAGLHYTLLENDTYEVDVFGYMTEKEVTIPATHNGKPVTRIAENAFKSNWRLTKITLPSSLKSIGPHAFDGCHGLSSIIIPAGTEIIEDSAFQSCSKLASITLPNSLTSIGSAAFAYCYELQSIQLPSGISHIEGSTFYYCNKIKKLSLPDGVTSIGNSSFSGCTALKDIQLPEGILSIGEAAFMNCAALTDILIPKSVTSIGKSAFASCTNLKDLSVAEGNPIYHSNGNCIIETSSKTLIIGCRESIIPDDGSVTGIGTGAFSGCAYLTSIHLPKSIVSIGQRAFAGSGISNIQIPGSVAVIEDNTFRDCNNLISIRIPEGVTSIGTTAFHSCDKLTSINISKTVTYIDPLAFSYCKALKSIQVAPQNPVYRSFGNCLIETVSQTLIIGCQTSILPTDGSVTTIREAAFYECTNLTEIAIPEGITSIGKNAFFGCGQLTEISLPNTLTTIADGAFSCCTNLESIQIPESVTYIGTGAFTYCSSLETVRLPEGITTVHADTFSDCGNLSSIILPRNLTIIEEQAFYASWGSYYVLEHIFFEGTALEWSRITLSTNGNDALTNAPVYFYSETEPATESNFWHYVDGVPTPW